MRDGLSRSLLQFDDAVLKCGDRAHDNFSTENGRANTLPLGKPKFPVCCETLPSRKMCVGKHSKIGAKRSHAYSTVALKKWLTQNESLYLLRTRDGLCDSIKGYQKDSSIARTLSTSVKGEGRHGSI